MLVRPPLRIGFILAHAGEPYLHLWSAFVPIRMGSPRNLAGKFSLGGRLWTKLCQRQHRGINPGSKSKCQHNALAIGPRQLTGRTSGRSCGMQVLRHHRGRLPREDRRRRCGRRHSRVLKEDSHSGNETQEPDNPKHGTRNPPTTPPCGPTYPILQLVHYTV